MENDLKYIKHSRIPRNKQILFSIFDCTDFKYNQDNYFYYDKKIVLYYCHKRKIIEIAISFYLYDMFHTLIECFKEYYNIDVDVYYTSKIE